MMKNQEISRRLQTLTDLLSRASKACGEDAEMLSHWAKYLCVLHAGPLETAIEQLFTDFAKRAASSPVANHVRSTLSSIQNPKAAKFVDVARSFKSDWAVRLEQYMEQDGRKDAIDSIMANRPSIAHGRHSGLTLARLKEYIGKEVLVLEFIENLLLT